MKKYIYILKEFWIYQGGLYADSNSRRLMLAFFLLPLTYVITTVLATKNFLSLWKLTYFVNCKFLLYWFKRLPTFPSTFKLTPFFFYLENNIFHKSHWKKYLSIYKISFILKLTYYVHNKYSQYWTEQLKKFLVKFHQVTAWTHAHLLSHIIYRNIKSNTVWGHRFFCGERISFSSRTKGASKAKDNINDKKKEVIRFPKNMITWKKEEKWLV